MVRTTTIANIGNSVMTHKVSVEARKIINNHRTDTQNVLPVYRDMQVALITHHFGSMDKKTQERAIDTVTRLNKHKHEPLI